MKKTITIFLFATLVNVCAQETPFINAEVDTALRNELSGEIMYDNLRLLTQWHRPEGSLGLLHAQQFIAERARAYGLSGVRVVDQPWDGQTYEPIFAELWMISPRREKLASRDEVAVALADYSRTTHLSAELVDVGDGDKEADYDGKDISGKIVLAAANPHSVMPFAVWKYAAVGLVCYNSTRVEPFLEAPDQVAWSSIPFKNKEGKEGTFAFILSPRQGLALKDVLNPTPDRAIFGGGRKTAPKRVMLKVDIEAKFHQPRQGYVEAFVRGKEITNQDIVLTAHAQEEKFSANDDGSGCVSILEIGRALARLINDGALPPPRRSIRFWWTNEIASEYQLFKDVPATRESLLVNINQDMVGAKQSLGGRVQHITRPPLSRAGFLGDIVESIATYVMQTNNGYLSARLQGGKGNYPRGIFSRLGTREPYHAEVVPYFDSTDHLVFNDGPIGIPGVTLTNWPDEIIHSSDDDLWNIDRTQLKRNAYIVAASAWYLANAGEAELPVLAATMYGRGRGRLGHAAAVALQRVGKAADRATAYRESRIIIEQTYKREREALSSLAKLSNSARRDVLVYAGSFVEEYQAAMIADLAQLDNFYESLSGQKPARVQLTTEERALASKAPKNINNLKAYFEARDNVNAGKANMNGHMVEEVWNFVDGKRSMLEIYRAVFAEAALVGPWYYGTVTLEGVKYLLEEGIKQGALVL